MTPAERITPEAVRDAVALALRDIAEKFLSEEDGPAKLADWKWRTCEAIGVDQRTLESWMGRETAPRLTELLRLFLYFREPFADKVTALADLVTANVADVGAVADAKAYRELRKGVAGIGAIVKGLNEAMAEPDPLAEDREAAG